MSMPAHSHSRFFFYPDALQFCKFCDNCQFQCHCPPSTLKILIIFESSSPLHAIIPRQHSLDSLRSYGSFRHFFYFIIPSPPPPFACPVLSSAAHYLSSPHQSSSYSFFIVVSEVSYYVEARGRHR